MKSRFTLALTSALIAVAISIGAVTASPPELVNHQGRIAVGGVNFDGTGHFKFALVDGSGTSSFWSNDGTSVGGAEPTTGIAVIVTKGHYAVSLGETNPIPANTFVDNDDVRLNVWFSQSGGGGTFELLSPAPRFSSVGYAMSAEHAEVAASAESIGGLLTTTVEGSVVIGGSGHVPLHPLVALGYAFDARGLDIAVEGTTVFLAGDRVRRYDVSDPGAIIFLSTNVTLQNTVAVAAQGNFVYVTDGASVQVLDVTNPGFLPRGSTPIDVIDPFGVVRHEIIVQGNYAYVMSGNILGGMVEILDITDPDNIFPVIGGMIPSGGGGIALVGNLLHILHTPWIVLGTPPSLQIFDVTNPAAPTMVPGGSTSTGLGQPTDLAVSGGVAYITDSSGSVLRLYDVSTPGAIAPLGTHALGMPTPSGVSIDGDVAYVISNIAGELRSVDVSDPNAPVALSRFPGMPLPTAVWATGGAAYVSFDGPFTEAFGIFAPELARTSVVGGGFHLTGALVDASGIVGGKDQFLSSTGSGTGWVDLLDNDPSNELQTLSLSGSNLTLSPSGGNVSMSSLVAATPNGAITSAMLAPGAVTIDHLSAPGSGNVLVSDGNGGAAWMSADDFLLAQGYTPSLPGIVENLTPIEIAGIFVGTVQIVNGPGMTIEDLGGNPSQSGLSAEFQMVFDYDGPENGQFQLWHDTPTPQTISIIVTDNIGAETYRWNLYSFELTSIVNGGGNDGKNRYTLSHTQAPNNTLEIERTPPTWPANVDKREGDTEVEITGGVISNLWPQVTHDLATKTLTMTFDYNEGDDIFQWAKALAEQGTSAGHRQSISLIYNDNSGVEIGRNNFYECFPIRYQHFTGFDVDIKGREQVVISYDSSENASTGSLPLYTPPIIEYHPGTPLMEMPYDLATNELTWEIPGVLTNTVTLPGELPVMLSGPGFEIERIPGFDGFGDPDDQSGNNKEFPLVLEVGGTDLTNLSQWQINHLEGMPTTPDPRSLSVIVKNSGAVEQFRINAFNMIPFEIIPLPSGRSRVTLYNNLAPNNALDYEFDVSGGGDNWGENLQNNPATDSLIEISGITVVHAETSIDATARTITLTYDYGEGGSIFAWAEDVAQIGTTTIGKRSLIIDSTTNYFGCFPIAFQVFTGFEQDSKIKAKVVMSYDTTSAP